MFHALTSYIFMSSIFCVQDLPSEEPDSRGRVVIIVEEEAPSVVVKFTPRNDNPEVYTIEVVACAEGSKCPL